MGRNTQYAHECNVCGRPLDGNGVWLEYNNRTNDYHKPGTVPEADSLGLYHLGSDCARLELAKSAKTLLPETHEARQASRGR